MADDKILIPFGIDQSGFKGDIDDLLKYLEKQTGKSLDGIGKEVVKRFTKGPNKGAISQVFKQLMIPMADGSMASVLFKQTLKSKKVASGKGNVRVTGGLHSSQADRINSISNIDDYDNVVKFAKKEAKFRQKVDELAIKYRKNKGKFTQDSLLSLSSSISDQKKIGSEQGFQYNKLDALDKVLRTYTQRHADAEKILDEIMYKGSSVYEKQKIDLEKVSESLENAKNKFKEYYIAGKDTKEIEKEIKGLNKEMSKLGKQPPLNGIQKFINTIKRVGFYRIARNLFRFVEAGFSSASKSLIEIDDGVNSTMSSLATSAEKISSSFALVLLPALQVIEPLVTDIADSFVDFANKISEANAQMLGLSEYTKVSEEYMKDLRDTTNSLSFDKFNALSGSTTSAYTKGTTDETKDLSKYKNFIVMIQGFTKGIIETIRKIFDVAKKLIDVISPHIDGIVKLLGSLLVILTSVGVFIADIVAKIITWLDKNGMLESSIYGILTAVLLFKGIGIITTLVSFVGILDKAFTSLGNITIQLGKLISKLFTTTAGLNTLLFVATALVGIASFKFFDSILENGPRWVSIITAIAGALATLAVAYLAVTHQWAKAVALPTLALTAGLMIAGFKNSISAYENGGIAEKGDLFIANESGPELVYSGQNNSSSIMNISQFKQAMVEAIYECADVFQGSEGAVVVSLDGAEIARSKRFKSELNRTNSGLNLR